MVKGAIENIDKFRLLRSSNSILVVDDEPGVREMLPRYLENEGFRVKSVADGSAMRGMLARASFDLVLLDLILPGDDGLDLIKFLRAQYPQIGIIIVTSKNEEIDRIVGLEIGADDFVTKPFSLRELLARIKALLRRFDAHSVVTQPYISSQYEFDSWKLDSTKFVLFDVKGCETRLTASEFNLLRAFLDNANKVLSREQILYLTRGHSSAPLDRVVDVQVKRLRQKIERNPEAPQLIKTIRGAGYIMATTVKKAQTPTASESSHKRLQDS